MKENHKRIKSVHTKRVAEFVAKMNRKHRQESKPRTECYNYFRNKRNKNTPNVGVLTQMNVFFSIISIFLSGLDYK